MTSWCGSATSPSTTAASRLSMTSRSTSAVARSWPSSAPPDRVSRPCVVPSTVWSRSRRGGSRSTEPHCLRRVGLWHGCAPRWEWSSSPSTSSRTVQCWTTSPWRPSRCVVSLGAGLRSVPGSYWPESVWRTRPESVPPSSPEGSSSASPSPARWPWTPSSCSSMNPPAPWTRR